MKKIPSNIAKIFKKRNSLIWILVSVCLLWFFFYSTSQSALTIWNLWINFFYTELVLQILLTIVFSIFIWANIYKISYFSNFSKKESSAWMTGTFFWILVTGCPSCSITLASYFWLASIVSLLPFDGLELKFLGLFILLYSSFTTLKNLETCKIKKW